MKKLFIILVGCKPIGRNTEQHDVMFTVAENIEDITSSILKKFWPENNGAHIDGWMEVTHVEKYKVEIVEECPESDNKLFFINFGGYQEGEFEEFHKKILVVATKKTEAFRIAKEDKFYSEGQGMKTAMKSHFDDYHELGLVAEDVVVVEEEIGKDFYILLTPSENTDYPKTNMGYRKVKQ